jgi:hypothetical protein
MDGVGGPKLDSMDAVCLLVARGTFMMHSVGDPKLDSTLHYCTAMDYLVAEVW